MIDTKSSYLFFIVLVCLLTCSQLIECKSDPSGSSLNNSSESQRTKKTLSEIFEENKAKKRSHFESKIQNDANFKRLFGESLNRNFLPFCVEILQPTVGVSYPWYEVKLPSTTLPIHYNLEILLSDPSNINVFDGFIDVTFDVTVSTTYLLFHAENTPTITELLDKTGHAESLYCEGIFTHLKANYYILKPLQPLQPRNGPYTAKFLFLNEYSGANNRGFNYFNNIVHKKIKLKFNFLLIQINLKRSS